jgi:hypothetical protein
VSHLSSQTWGNPPAATAAPVRDRPLLRPKPAAGLWAEDVAARAGVNPKTINRYNSVAAANRDRGAAAPRDLPCPDGWEPNPRGGPPHPWWYPATIEAWLRLRQISGRPPAGGGKPKPRKKIRGKPGPKPRRRT